MLTLYSYPALFGVADNNGYGLKVFAFLRLAGVPFRHEHIFDASKAPRGQLPYIVDDSDTVGDSETHPRLSHPKIPADDRRRLTPRSEPPNLLITRMLDDLYWVMSYSRWQDERFWPAFRAALLREHPSLTEEGLPRRRHSITSATTTRASAATILMPRWRAESPTWQVLADLIPAEGYVHGETPTSIDAGDLRLHRQHLFLRHRYAAEAIHRRARQHRLALLRHT